MNGVKSGAPLAVPQQSPNGYAGNLPMRANGGVKNGAPPTVPQPVMSQRPMNTQNPGLSEALRRMTIGSQPRIVR